MTIRFDPPGGNGHGTLDRRPLVVGIGGSMRPRSTTLTALERALAGAEAAGARAELLDVRALALPMYEPDLPVSAFGDGAVRLVRAARRADALLLATPAYQGTLAGVVKNALDYLQFLAADDPPYLTGKVVGLIATADGGQAAPNAVAALVHAAHALRAVVAPFTVPIPRAWSLLDPGGEVADPWGRRLDALGQQVADLAAALRAGKLEAIGDKR
jgi:FMN reductase